MPRTANEVYPGFMPHELPDAAPCLDLYPESSFLRIVRRRTLFSNFQPCRCQLPVNARRSSQVLAFFAPTFFRLSVGRFLTPEKISGASPEKPGANWGMHHVCKAARRWTGRTCSAKYGAGLHENDVSKCICSHPGVVRRCACSLHCWQTIAT